MRYHGVLVRCEAHPDRTLGSLILFHGLSKIAQFASLEPAWHDNERLVSCIPDGRYECVQRTSARFGPHLHIQGVEGRDWVLIHRGNFVKDTAGCVLLGYQHVDLDGDRVPEVGTSRAAIEFLLTVLGDEPMTLTVVDPA